MGVESSRQHKHIAYFNPDVMSLEQAHQDFSTELKKFNAGELFGNFNDFLMDEAVEYRDSGDGVTYVVWNVTYDEEEEIERQVVAFYTLAMTAIPYEDRIRLDEDEAKLSGKEFDSKICGISALEIKMFAVDEQFQDVFFDFEGEDLPISAWIMRDIIDYANMLLNSTIGFKALFLHALPNAEHFYSTNGFYSIKENMKPLYSVDSEYTAMYMPLKEVHINYDK